MDDEQREEQGEIAFDIAVNTFQTADNLRDMGFGEAGDVLERQAQWAADEARRLGYAPEPTPPEPPLPGEQTSMGPITKGEWDRSVEHTKEWEDIKDRLGEGPDVHLDPNVTTEPIPRGSPPPRIFK